MTTSKPPSHPYNQMQSEALKEAQDFIAATHNKLTRIAQSFANGDLNRAQFQHLYTRYQRQIIAVAEIIAEADPTTWRDAIQDDLDASLESIRASLTAEMIGFSVFDKNTGLPIESDVVLSADPELVVSMLSSYREAAVELFGANVQRLVLDNGHVLHFIMGDFAAVLIVFSLEPSANQLRDVEQIYQTYELTNQFALKRGDIEAIAFPFTDLLDQLKDGSPLPPD